MRGLSCPLVLNSKSTLKIKWAELADRVRPVSFDFVHRYFVGCWHDTIVQKTIGKAIPVTRPSTILYGTSEPSEVVLSIYTMLWDRDGSALENANFSLCQSRAARILTRMSVQHYLFWPCKIIWESPATFKLNGKNCKDTRIVIGCWNPPTLRGENVQMQERCLAT